MIAANSGFQHFQESLGAIERIEVDFAIARVEWTIRIQNHGGHAAFLAFRAQHPLVVVGNRTGDHHGTDVAAPQDSESVMHVRNRDNSVTRVGQNSVAYGSGNTFLGDAQDRVTHVSPVVIWFSNIGMRFKESKSKDDQCG
jgi:hypothetical protein